MSTPRASSAYPGSMLEALHRALAEGEFRIPCTARVSPAALRLQFYGLCRALRLENKPELPEALGFYLDPDGQSLIIRLKDSGEIADTVSAALAGNSPAAPTETALSAEATATLRRILGEPEA